jgi:hypothetical protein
VAASELTSPGRSLPSTVMTMETFMKLGKQGGGGMPEKSRAWRRFGDLDFLPSWLVKSGNMLQPAPAYE